MNDFIIELKIKKIIKSKSKKSNSNEVLKQLIKITQNSTKWLK